MITRTAIPALLASATIFLTACSTVRPIEQVRQSGDRHFKLEMYAAAADDYRELTERYPGDWVGHYQYGLCNLELGNYGEARRSLRVALDRRPGEVKIEDALAESMFRARDAESLYAFLRERAESTQSASAYLRLARYAMEMDDPDSAKVAIETAIVLDEGRTVDPYIAAADLAERIGDREGAVRRLCQAYGIDPKNTIVADRLRAMGEIPGPTIAVAPGR